MSAEKLRQAALQVRAATPNCTTQSSPIALAVADWLEDEADWIDADIDDNGVNNLAGYGPAFALADLILDGAS